MSEQNEKELNEILRVRREQLAALQAEGKDPFEITRYEQPHHSREIRDHFAE